MLAVTYPRVAQKGASAKLAHDEWRFIAALAGLAAVLLCVGWFGQPRGLVADQWYGVSSIEGVTLYTPYRSEGDCQAASSDGVALCVRGADLMG